MISVSDRSGGMTRPAMEPGCPAPPPRHHRRRNAPVRAASSYSANSAWTNHRRSSSPMRVEWVPSIVDMAFLEACRSADEPKLRTILRRSLTSSEINKQDRTGRTGLCYLCMNGHTHMVEMILDLPDLDINLPDNEGTTPLMYAAQAGHSDIVTLLLERFRRVINVDQRNAFGMTALMKAALQGRRKCVQLLLAAGANTVLVDPGRRFCALQWAQLCSRDSCASLLDKYMKAKGKRLPPTTIAPKPVSHAQNRCFSEPDLFPVGLQTSHSASALDNMGKSESSWLKEKFKKTFRATDGGKKKTQDSYNLNNNISSTVLCASSVILPNVNDMNEYSRENGIRPIVVPKLVVTGQGSTYTIADTEYHHSY